LPERFDIVAEATFPGRYSEYLVHTVYKMGEKYIVDGYHPDFRPDLPDKAPALLVLSAPSEIHVLSMDSLFPEVPEGFYLWGFWSVDGKFYASFIKVDEDSSLLKYKFYEYELFSGKVREIPNPPMEVWRAVRSSSFPVVEPLPSERTLSLYAFKGSRWIEYASIQLPSLDLYSPSAPEPFFISFEVASWGLLAGFEPEHEPMDKKAVETLSSLGVLSNATPPKPRAQDPDVGVFLYTRKGKNLARASISPPKNYLDVAISGAKMAVLIKETQGVENVEGAKHLRFIALREDSAADGDAIGAGFVQTNGALQVWVMPRKGSFQLWAEKSKRD